MTVSKKRVAASVATAAVALALPVSAFASFYPNRPTYDFAQGADHVTFNSISNNPHYGDERYFLDAKDSTVGGVGGYQDVVNVKDGQELIVRAYIHNNANPSIASEPNYTAKNTTFKVQLPTGTVNDMQLTSVISADNAYPRSVSDTVELKSDKAFKVSYVPGSARFENNVFTNGVALNDAVAGNGTLLGYQTLNGSIPGCYQYAGYVTLRVKVSVPSTPNTPPVTPPGKGGTVLPDTGPESALGGLAGTGALGYAVMQYRRSRKALAEKLLDRK